MRDCQVRHAALRSSDEANVHHPSVFPTLVTFHMCCGLSSCVRHRRPIAKEAVTLLAEIEENFRQQGRLEAISTTNGPSVAGGDG